MMGVKPITAEELSMQSEPRPLTPQKATDCSAACTHRVAHMQKEEVCAACTHGEVEGGYNSFITTNSQYGQDGGPNNNRRLSTTRLLPRFQMLNGEELAGMLQSTRSDTHLDKLYPFRNIHREKQLRQQPPQGGGRKKIPQKITKKPPPKDPPKRPPQKIQKLKKKHQKKPPKETTKNPPKKPPKKRKKILLNRGLEPLLSPLHRHLRTYRSGGATVQARQQTKSSYCWTYMNFQNSRLCMQLQK